ncbi:hypothetical protein [Candidatus Stoquefichus massiliensis]|uniref:hypothetical protein n=1 Tax=Candidatus Stoquefichus massiliensis TaxID=1470350 RepID=UPI000488B687|nr:hypothetical protein [Candidatus Stoquefichus massiliensis]
MKKHVFQISVVLLIVILVVVSFYMLYIHVPYYNYHNNLNQIRNEICEQNNYEYKDYFSEYRGKHTYYMLKVNMNNVLSFVAYDQELKLVDTYQGNVADENAVKKEIKDKYNMDISQLEIGYENQRFVYYGRIQNDETLLYVYYDLSNGEFMKAVKLGE